MFKMQEGVLKIINEKLYLVDRESGQKLSKSLLRGQKLLCKLDIGEWFDTALEYVDGQWYLIGINGYAAGATVRY